MPPTLKRSLPLLIVLGLAGAVFFLRPKPAPPPPPKAPVPSPALSVLGEKPDWKKLEIYQETITRADFERLLTTVFVTGGAWRNFIELDDAEARIRTNGDDILHLRFATPGGQARPVPRPWKSTADLPPSPAGKPLDGLRIAIDPGHIGGRWARIEERWLQLPGGTPVCEGDMTLLVARLLKPRLEALGAAVSMVRDKPEPVTPLRPDSLMKFASESEPADSPEALRKLAERLFYRTAEIRARAKLVNETLQPDLVLCIHFNADPWGDPNNPTLVPRSHLHLLLNGAYTDEEVALADQRFAMIEKLLRRTHAEEALVGATVADRFALKTGLPPFAYPPGSLNALPVNGHPYLWARNLLANRLYDCPVIFMEPWLMNSTIDYPRFQAGDYEGLKEVSGKPQPSIFREYADDLTEGLARHYGENRGTPR